MNPLKAAHRIALTAALVLLALSTTSGGAEEKPKKNKRFNIYSSQIWKTRPMRRDEPLREENITDIEVGQIEGVMQGLYPGSIVYISAVTSGCPCEDGAKCEDQVWSVADRSGVMNEIALSKIEGKWQVGPLQQWWLVRDRIWETYRKARRDSDPSKRMDYREYRKRLQKHYEAFPVCAARSESDEV